MSREVAISLENVAKTFYINETAHNTIREKFFSGMFSSNKIRELKAIQRTSFRVFKGEVFGIIGKNGSGKSTLLRLIMGSLVPDKGGKVTTHGKILRLALGMGFDPNLSARDNIYVNGSILGLTFKRIGLVFDDIIGFAELEEFVETPVKYYSNGMKARLGFSIAMYTEADIFLLDEFFGGVGDLAFKRKSKLVFEKTITEGKTVVMVSHSLKNIQENCNRAMLLHKSMPRKFGSPETVINFYKNNYAKSNVKNPEI